MTVNDVVMNIGAGVGGFEPTNKYSEPSRSFLSKWSKSRNYGSESGYGTEI
jgi:hypothetical protein